MHSNLPCTAYTFKLNFIGKHLLEVSSFLHVERRVYDSIYIYIYP